MGVRAEVWGSCVFCCVCSIGRVSEGVHFASGKPARLASIEALSISTVS